MSEPKLTPAQERILRQAVSAGAYHLFGPRRASCDRLSEIGLLRPFFSTGETKAFMWIPTEDGQLWIQRRDKEAT